MLVLLDTTPRLANTCSKLTTIALPTFAPKMPTEIEKPSAPTSHAYSDHKPTATTTGMAVFDVEAQTEGFFDFYTTTQVGIQPRRGSSMFRAPNGGFGRTLESGRHVQDHAEVFLVLVGLFGGLCVFFVMVAIAAAMGSGRGE